MRLAVSRLPAANSARALEAISKIRLGFLARHEGARKRSVHVVREHFEPLRNTARGA